MSKGADGKYTKMPSAPFFDRRINHVRVMLVDNAAVMHIFVLNMLNRNPYLSIASFASSGSDALGQLDETNPDLILLDINMPEVDGLEFLRQARFKTQAKIVALNGARSDSFKAVQARALGADVVISKPPGGSYYALGANRRSEVLNAIYELMGIQSLANLVFA